MIYHGIKGGKGKRLFFSKKSSVLERDERPRINIQNVTSLFRNVGLGRDENEHVGGASDFVHVQEEYDQSLRENMTVQEKGKVVLLRSFQDDLKSLDSLQPVGSNSEGNLGFANTESTHCSSLPVDVVYSRTGKRIQKWRKVARSVGKHVSSRRLTPTVGEKRSSISDSFDEDMMEAEERAHSKRRFAPMEVEFIPTQVSNNVASPTRRALGSP